MKVSIVRLNCTKKNHMAIDYSNLLQKIRSGKDQRDQCIIWLYDEPTLDSEITKLFKSQTWDIVEKNDLKAQAIMSFVAMVVRNKQWINSSPIPRYICTIVRNEKITQLKSLGKYVSFPENNEEPDDAENIENNYFEAERFAQLSTLLSRIGEKCKEILLLWANDYSMQEISVQMGYAGEGMARKKKYNCLKQLVAYVTANPGLINEYRK